VLPAIAVALAAASPEEPWNPAPPTQRDSENRLQAPPASQSHQPAPVASGEAETHLQCEADFPLDTIRPLLTQLGTIEAEVVQRLGLPSRTEGIQIRLFRDHRSYTEYLQRYFPQIPFRRALFIQQGSICMVFAYRSPDFERDVRHEFVHAVLHAQLSTVPLWLDEGLAAYFEPAPPDRLAGSQYREAALQAATDGSLRAMGELEKLDDLAQLHLAEYRDCWAWASLLLDGPTAYQAALVRYIGCLAQGQVPTPLSQSCGTADVSRWIRDAAARSTAGEPRQASCVQFLDSPLPAGR